MDKRTAKALEASIAHWERNVAAETPEEVSVKGSDCALCNTFRRSGSCQNCPVMEHTKCSQCSGTPYADCVSKFIYWLDYSSDSPSRSAWRAAAQRELDFLKMLRVGSRSDPLAASSPRSARLIPRAEEK